MVPISASQMKEIHIQRFTPRRLGISSQSSWPDSRFDSTRSWRLVTSPSSHGWELNFGCWDPSHLTLHSWAVRPELFDAKSWDKIVTPIIEEWKADTHHVQHNSNLYLLRFPKNSHYRYVTRPQMHRFLWIRVSEIKTKVCVYKPCLSM